MGHWGSVEINDDIKQKAIYSLWKYRSNTGTKRIAIKVVYSKSQNKQDQL